MFFNLKGSVQFREEIESWVKEGIISSEQSQKLSQKYQLPELGESPPFYRDSSFILKGVAILIGVAGLMLIIAQNWDDLPIFARMLTGLLPLFAAYIWGFLKLKQDEEQTAELAFLLASLLFGVNIMLQAQIFHISSYFPNGVLWWILGTMPTMIYFRSKIIAIIFQGLFILWVSLQMEYMQFSIWSPILVLLFGYMLYIRPNILLLIGMFISLYLAFMNGISAIYQERFFRIVDEGYYIFGLSYLLLFLGIFQFLKDKYSDFIQRNFQNLLRFAFIFVLFLFTFKDIIEEITHDRGIKSYIYGKTEINYLVIGIMAIICILIYVYSVFIKAQKINFKTVLPLVLLVLLSVPLIIFSQDYDQKLAFFYNVVLLILSIWKIYDGIHNQQKGDFMTGIFYLLMLALARYFDLFENYVITGILFIVLGMGLYFINNFWNKKFSK
ncbi:putative membrane protein [Bernardetia litoralis DSM 6794]|uniref:Putative membrane protein n=1 Tax=Bernardetia litoralis (strain ATCC 23117 / DSM 6794 / NBRC 15988 / NCIMB 1366 / Fx l1 / Sio-4) TaxID=880071 RepID=I4AMH3_BERLS|nr:DUF2157 domain-containing protein [Bernardetia litoralis]AFM05158.1 putative membrane protein [Bernardetia litoralis DSM 6794]